MFVCVYIRIYIYCVLKFGNLRNFEMKWVKLDPCNKGQYVNIAGCNFSFSLGVAPKDRERER